MNLPDYDGIDTAALAMVADASVAAAAGAAAAHPNASAIIVEAPSASVAAVVAVAGAHAAAGAHVTDVRVALPDGARWTVDELAFKIVAPASMRPSLRNHVVVGAADQMASIASDRLLKVTEEPSAPTTFWLAVTDASTLPTTLRGRATSTVIVSLRDPDERAAHLAATYGLDLADASRLVEVCGVEVTVAAAAAAAGPDARAAFDALFTTPAPSAHPAVAARDVTALIDDVAGELATAAAARKDMARQLTAMQLDRWVVTERARLRSPDLDPVAYGTVTARLAAFATAQRSLTLSIAPGDVLAAAFAESLDVHR